MGAGGADLCARADPPAGPKQRVVVLTDIGNEPDEAESFVRFLLYTNQFDVEALVATTSNWQRDTVQPELLRERIAANGRVVGNLRKHAAGYPDAATLMAAVRSGATAFGMKGVGENKDMGFIRPVAVQCAEGANGTGLQLASIAFTPAGPLTAPDSLRP